MLKSLESIRPTINEDDFTNLLEFTEDFGQEGWSNANSEQVPYIEPEWYVRWADENILCFDAIYLECKHNIIQF